MSTESLTQKAGGNNVRAGVSNPIPWYLYRASAVRRPSCGEEFLHQLPEVRCFLSLSCRSSVHPWACSRAPQGLTQGSGFSFSGPADFYDWLNATVIQVISCTGTAFGVGLLVIHCTGTAFGLGLLAIRCIGTAFWLGLLLVAYW